MAYDGVGKDTIYVSLGPKLLLGGASGQVPPFDIQRLKCPGGIFASRPARLASPQLSGFGEAFSDAVQRHRARLAHLPRRRHVPTGQ